MLRLHHLDYLITKFLYENSGHELTPGALSDMRSALVNNVTFAVLSVRYGFHRFLKHMVPDTHHAIDRFVQQQELCDHSNTSDEVRYFLNTNNFKYNSMSMWFFFLSHTISLGQRKTQ